MEQRRRTLRTAEGERDQTTQVKRFGACRIIGDHVSADGAGPGEIAFPVKLRGDCQRLG
ncbi:MAG: hypothetical protein JNL04_25070 [Rhodospirillaceae bacterium]|nr:hypothetical protein [Rhodospirillaceae bacterium]